MYPFTLERPSTTAEAANRAYIEDLRETIRGNYHVMRLYGQMKQYNFIYKEEIE
jgi:hypothetical protein